MVYSEEDFLQLSGIQHFAFCRRQWALIHIENQWAENQLTAEGQVIHQRVHTADEMDVRSGVLTIRGLYIKSSILGISGICDAVEFKSSDEGVPLQGRKGLWQPAPVEYKHGKSKYNDCDRLQTVAQVMCLEEMFGCEIPKAYLFYHETRRREEIVITQAFRDSVSAAVAEMHNYYHSGHTPKVKTGSFCAKCSIKDVCLPVLLKEKNSRSVSAYISDHLEDNKS